MKLTNFKMYPLMLALSAFLALSGCDGTTGISSDTGIAASTPTPTPPTPTPPTPMPVPDAETSAVIASPVTIAADGSETSTITVTVNDAGSNPVTNASVSLDQGSGSSTIGAVTNVGDGTYTFNVTSTTPETVTYTATADGVTIMQTASVTFTQTEAQCLWAAGGYETIVIKDINDINRTWLDRNLGASEAAAAPDDIAAFGDYYQWGRSTDGHQESTSDTNDTLATTLDSSDTNTAWYGKFILSKRTNLDWVASNVDNNGSLRELSWSNPYDATNNPNQVCPCGYIVPTAQDFVDLNLSNPDNMDIFKVAYADDRTAQDGVNYNRNLALFWTTTHDNNDSHYLAIWFGKSGNVRNDGPRGTGLSIRCIKPLQ